MADILAIHEKSGVALRSLRKLDRLGFLHVDKTKDKIGDSIKLTIKKHSRLNTLQLLHLYQTPKLADKLDLESEVRELGDVSRDAAPWIPVGVRIQSAAGRSADAIVTIAEFIRDILDTLPAGQEVNHAYIGVRLLANVPEEHISNTLKKLRPCMWNVRASEILAGYSRLDKNGTSRYFRKIELDL